MKRIILALISSVYLDDHTRSDRVAYSIEEKETVIRTDELMDCFEVESRQRKFITKIKKIEGCEIISEEATEKGIVIAGRYRTPIWSITFRKRRYSGGYQPQNEEYDEGDDEVGEELSEQE